MYYVSHSVILSIREVLFETELKFCSKVTSFHSQTEEAAMFGYESLSL